jgi:hypothetical protein
MAKTKRVSAETKIAIHEFMRDNGGFVNGDVGTIECCFIADMFGVSILLVEQIYNAGHSKWAKKAGKKVSAFINLV